MAAGSQGREMAVTRSTGRLALVDEPPQDGDAAGDLLPLFDNTVGLTEREAEVLRLVASAMSNEEISRSLWISPNTVKTYIRSAYSRIGVQTRTQAVVWAYDHRLVTPATDH